MPPRKKKTEREDETTAEAAAEVAPAPKKTRKDAKKVESDGEDEPSPVRKRSSSGATITEESVLAGTVPFQRKTTDKDFDPKKMWKFITWNVAGLRAVCRNGTELQDLIKQENPDVLCIQEVKVQDLEEAAGLGQIPGYSFEDCVSTSKKGYSGTRTYIKDGIKFKNQKAPFFGDTGKTEDDEGRILTTQIDAGSGSPLYVVNSYVPNSGMKLERLEYRDQTFDPQMRNYLHHLQTSKAPVIWTGDLNVAERDYDRFFNNWKAMCKCPGFTPEERVSFRKTLEETKMVDSLRHLYPNAHKVYTFWSKMFNQRAKGNGWRLDYFVVSQQLASKIVDCFPLPDFKSSDHVPLVLWLQR